MIGKAEIFPEPNEHWLPDGSVPTACAKCPFCSFEVHVGTHDLRVWKYCEHFYGYSGTVKEINTIAFKNNRYPLPSYMGRDIP